MISADPTVIAHPLMRIVALAGLGCPVVSMDNAAVEFVSTMPQDRTAPARISGVTYTTLPAVLCTHRPVALTDPTLAGGTLFAEGFADFIVVTPRNEFSTRANAIAAQIAALFPKGRTVFLTAGRAIITRPAMPMAGYDDGVHWRVPVRVNYRAA